MACGFKKLLRFIRIIKDAYQPMIRIVPIITNAFRKNLMNNHFWHSQTFGFICLIIDACLLSIRIVPIIFECFP